jgi:hypothetical protein
VFTVFRRKNPCHPLNRMLGGLIWTFSRKKSLLPGFEYGTVRYPSRYTDCATLIPQYHLDTENLQSINMYFPIFQSIGRLRTYFGEHWQEIVNSDTLHCHTLLSSPTPIRACLRSIYIVQLYLAHFCIKMRSHQSVSHICDSTDHWSFNTNE